MDDVRTVEVPAGRIERWVHNFGERHGTPHISASPDAVLLEAPDCAVARLRVPWLPWHPGDDEPVDALVAHVAVPRLFGVILARRSAHSIGVVRGTRVERSTTDTHYVQGRTKKGGWSQQRYARRRGNQARKAWQDAADDVAAVLVPLAGSLDHVVCGGDAGAIDAIWGDARLAALAAVRERSPQRVWPTPDPRRAVLEGFVETFQSVAVELNALA